MALALGMALSMGDGHRAAGSARFHDKMHADAGLPVTMESLSAVEAVRSIAIVLRLWL